MARIEQETLKGPMGSFLGSVYLSGGGLFSELKGERNLLFAFTPYQLTLYLFFRVRSFSLLLLVIRLKEV